MARHARPARSERGRLILAAIKAQGLTITSAAKRCRVAFRTMFDLVHRPDISKMSLDTVERVCTRLKVPLEVVSPVLARHSA